MSTIQYIHDRASALPEDLQREALDFIDFLAAKYNTTQIPKTSLTARAILRLSKEQRHRILTEQAEMMSRHYAENPQEILPDIQDQLYEETP